MSNYAFLVWARDFLAAITYPASVQTIQVTRAFREHRAIRRWWLPTYDLDLRRDRSAGLPLDDTSFRYGQRLAALVSRYRFYTGVLIVFSIWAAVVVFSGRVLIRENEAFRHQQHTLEARILSVYTDDICKCGAANDMSTAPFRSADDLCTQVANPKPASGTPSGSSAAKDVSSLARLGALCKERDDLKKDISDWNILATRWRLALSPITVVLFYGPQRIGEKFTGEKLTEPGDSASLKTERYRMDQLVDGLLGSILPVCYACLGALAALFRRLTIKVESETLGPSDFGNMSSSLILGVLTGSVIGIFGDIMPVGHENALPIGTTALSLLAGFASDRVFAMLDAAAERVFGRGDDVRVKPKLP